VDPLLKRLENTGLGPSVLETYAGAFTHADDIRTISSSLATLQKQIDTVHKFAMENGLTCNPTKCEVALILSFKPTASTPAATLGSQALVPQHHARCLGCWWSWDLSATRAVDKVIKTSNFFAFEALGAIHGKLNPVSARSIFECCMVPVLLYGCENQFTDSMRYQLESFQGEIG
jgi:C1A family cysteine protease